MVGQYDFIFYMHYKKIRTDLQDQYASILEIIHFFPIINPLWKSIVLTLQEEGSRFI